MNLSQSSLSFSEEILHIADCVRAGKVILYPTDTIWGIGGSISIPAVSQKIFDIKGRPPSKSFILLVNDVAMLSRYIHPIPPKIENILSVTSRPITVIYPYPINLPSHCLADDGSVAIRICADNFCKELIQELDECIISTSANVSGKPFPRFFGEVSSDVLSSVDCIVKHRQWDKAIGEPSTLIKYGKDDSIEFLR
ncbi:MAG: Sua5/YciO/YrdC/YwlC family protein [Saprospiraceae bacterium]|nr:Sua5/YciO/YrdC/YwlC family protein [Saprospiraceae bacterium]